jgi:hypothetical protein
LSAWERSYPASTISTQPSALSPQPSVLSTITAVQDSSEATQLASVARETFEHGIVPWAGRKHEEWVRAWSSPHPRDPRGLVQLPDSIYRAFQGRTPGQRLTREQAKALGYPRVPSERLAVGT